MSDRSDTGTLRLRLATAEDIVAVSALEEACFAVPWSEASIREQLRNPLALNTVAELDGKLVGCLTATVLVPECELDRIAVAPAFRRLGVGAALLSDALSRMRERGGETVWLEVRASNSAALALYRSAGFTGNGIRRQYYRRPVEDAAILMKGLLC